jgi:putative zinc finger/helix-turn-helix YgiT family protein
MSGHLCEESSEERRASNESPYHYVGSGLSNVYLSGIRYSVCQKCGMQSAEIPALKELLTALARTVVEKRSQLTGDEIRFLRKRLGKKSADFAEMIGLTPEYFSRLENGKIADAKGAGQSTDKLIRIIYSQLSGDKKLKSIFDKRFEQWLTEIHSDEKKEIIFAARTKKKQWRIATEIEAA